MLILEWCVTAIYVYDIAVIMSHLPCYWRRLASQGYYQVGGQWFVPGSMVSVVLSALALPKITGCHPMLMTTP